MYQTKMIELEKDIICVGKHSNEPIIAIIEDNRLSIQQRLICAKCIDDQHEIGKLTSFKNMKKKILERRESVYNISEKVISQIIEQIDLFKNNLNQTKNNILTVINEINKKAEEWNQILQYYAAKQQKFSLLEELSKVNQDDLEQCTKSIQEIRDLNQTYFDKTENTFQKLTDLLQFDQCQESFYKISQNSCTILQQQFLKINQNNEIFQMLSKIKCPQHSKKIKFIGQSTVYCDYCVMSQNSFSVVEFASKWSDYMVQKSEFIQNQFSKRLSNCISNLKQYKAQQVNTIQTLINEIQRKDFTQQLFIPNDMNQVLSMAQEYSQHLKNRIFCFDNSYVLEEKQLFFQILQHCKGACKLMGTITQTLKNELILYQQKKIKVEEVSSTVIQHYIKTIVFNYNSSYMLAGTIRDSILLFKFNQGSYIYSESLQHPTNITSIACSRKKNWFVSSSCKQTIRLWQEDINNKWQYKQYIYHKAEVTALLLANNEQEILSSGADMIINVYEVNNQDQRLIFLYALNKHQKSIFCMDINEEDTTLVSCSRSSEIILWRRDLNRKWRFHQALMSQGYFGQNIKFLSLNRFTYSGTIYELQNDKYIQSVVTPWNQSVCQDFSIFDPQRNLFITSDSADIKIYKIQGDVISYEIGFELASFYLSGNMTHDGNYLVIWSKADSKIHVFNLTYAGY